MKKDREIEEYNRRFFKRLFKSLIYTIFVSIFVLFGIDWILNLIFGYEDFNLIVSFYIGIIFTVFYCSLIIIEEIKGVKN